MKRIANVMSEAGHQLGLGVFQRNPRIDKLDSLARLLSVVSLLVLLTRLAIVLIRA